MERQGHPALTLRVDLGKQDSKIARVAHDRTGSRASASAQVPDERGWSNPYV
jgi:hypothetical protein